MKKVIVLLSGILFAIAVTACDDKRSDNKSLLALLLAGGGTPVTGVSLNKIRTGMLVGGTELPGATVMPAAASNRDLI